MFTLSLSYTRQQGLTTYLGPLKNCCPKLKSACQKKPKTEQPTQAISQSCQKRTKKTNVTAI